MTSVSHNTTVRDTSGDGYGPYGHGRWLIECDCGWKKVSSYGGKNGAESDAWLHRSLENERNRDGR